MPEDLSTTAQGDLWERLLHYLPSGLATVPLSAAAWEQPLGLWLREQAWFHLTLSASGDRCLSLARGAEPGLPATLAVQTLPLWQVSLGNPVRQGVRVARSRNLGRTVMCHFAHLCSQPLHQTQPLTARDLVALVTVLRWVSGDHPPQVAGRPFF